MDLKDQVEHMDVTQYLKTRLGGSAAVKATAQDLETMVNQWYSWHAAERNELEQQIEELELEVLLLETEAYKASPIKLNIKRRRNTHEQDPY